MVLDTNVLIEIERENKAIVEEIMLLTQEYGEDAFIASPSYSEFLFGVLVANKDKRMALEFISEYSLLNTSKNSSILFSEIKNRLSKTGKMVSNFDILIASICIAEGKTLVTMDEDFTKIQGLNCVLLVN